MKTATLFAALLFAAQVNAQQVNTGQGNVSAGCPNCSFTVDKNGVTHWRGPGAQVPVRQIPEPSALLLLVPAALLLLRKTKR